MAKPEENKKLIIEGVYYASGKCDKCGKTGKQFMFVRVEDRKTEKWCRDCCFAEGMFQGEEKK